MTYIQELLSNLDLMKRLLSVFNEEDVSTKYGKDLYQRFKRREEHYEELITAYKWDKKYDRIG